MKPSRRARRLAKEYLLDAYRMEAILQWRKATGVDETDPVQTWPATETLVRWLVEKL
jgi:hypothetical protein